MILLIILTLKRSKNFLVRKEERLLNFPTIDANDRDYPINLPFEEDIPIIIWYFDADGDGYHSDTTEAETSPGTNWSNTTQGEDCDDSDASIRQGCDVCVRECTAQERAVETANKNAGTTVDDCECEQIDPCEEIKKQLEDQELGRLGLELYVEDNFELLKEIFQGN